MECGFAFDSIGVWLLGGEGEIHVYMRLCRAGSRGIIEQRRRELRSMRLYQRLSFVDRDFGGAGHVWVCVVVLAGFERWVCKNGHTFEGAKSGTFDGVVSRGCLVFVENCAHALADLADVWEEES